MKIKLNKQDLKQVYTLIEVKETNTNIAEMYLYFCANEARSITKEMIDRLSSSLHINEETAFYHLVMEALGIDLADEENEEIGAKFCLPGIKMLDPQKYKDNPYYQNIKTNKITSGKWEISYQNYLPYQGFIYDDVLVNENDFFMEVSHLGFFTEEFTYLAAIESDVTWMSVTPNEIETMEKPLHQVKGNVITFGLGLGYFAYMASIKEDVHHVTIIEKNKDIIALFTKNILPQFSHPEKIEIISMDAFIYAKDEMPKRKFDYAFVDLWHGADDGLSMYLKMKTFESYNPNTQFLYWLEPSIIALLRRCILTIVSEQLAGSTDKDYLKSANKIDVIINKIYWLLKDYSIENYQDLQSLLKDASLQELAHKIDLK